MSQITKHALEDSLKVLLLRKPFNKITIGDLTKECGINRMTFYYHFTDMHHLLSWIILDEIHQLFIVGRSFEYYDILMDTLGSLLMIIIIKVIKDMKK